MPNTANLQLTFKQLIDQFNKIGKDREPSVTLEQPQLKGGQLESHLTSDPTILLVAGGTSVMNKPLAQVGVYYSAGQRSSRHTQVFGTLFDVLLPSMNEAEKSKAIERIHWDLASHFEIPIAGEKGKAPSIIARGILNNGQMRCVEVRPAGSTSALQVLRRV